MIKYIRSLNTSLDAALAFRSNRCDAACEAKFLFVCVKCISVKFFGEMVYVPGTSFHLTRSFIFHGNEFQHAISKFLKWLANEC